MFLCRINNHFSIGGGPDGAADANRISLIFINHLRHQRLSNYLFPRRRAGNKYGQENFDFSLLEFCSADQVRQRET